MEDVVGYTDAFVICSGQNARHVQAVGEEVELILKREDGLLPKGGEGRRDGDWILLDYLDCVLHVFTPEAREFYRLADLWDDVPHETVEAATA